MRQLLKRMWAGVSVALITFVGATLYATSPMNGDFFWSDAPRHALNGAFLLDLLRDLPWHAPKRWAYDYYLQYPALSILFYPPLFYILLVPIYWVFGVSEAAALILNAVFLCILGWSTTTLARRVVPPLGALGAGVAAMAAPELAFWGRMVMLDVPAIALMTWSIVYLVRFGEDNRTADLIAFLILFVSCLYTKQPMVFVVPALAGYLLWARSWKLALEPRVWIAGISTAFALTPLAYMHLVFGSFNIDQAAAESLRQGNGMLDEWAYYLKSLPGVVTWPVIAAAIAGAGLVVTGKTPRRDLCVHLLLLGWLALWYIAFSTIALKSARFALPAVVPLSVLAATGICATSRRYGPSLVFLGAAALLAYTLVYRPVHALTGVQDAALTVGNLAPHDSNVLYSGKDDGSFIFAMRAVTKRPDLSILRADKILLRIRVLREMGVQQTEADDQKLLDMVRDLGIKTIVHHSKFWNDIPVVARFERLLASSAFTEIARIPLVANFPTRDATSLVIYRPNFPVADGRPRAPVALGLTADIIQ